MYTTVQMFFLIVIIDFQTVVLPNIFVETIIHCQNVIYLK